MLKNYYRIIAIFVLGLLLGFLVGYQGAVSQSSFRPESTTVEAKTIAASLMIDFGEGEIIVCHRQELTDGATVFDLLKTCAEDKDEPFQLEYDDYPSLGVLIKQIGDRVSGQDNRYWQYWVNNNFAQVGASQFKLNNNNTVEWKFIKSKF